MPFDDTFGQPLGINPTEFVNDLIRQQAGGTRAPGLAVHPTVEVNRLLRKGLQAQQGYRQPEVPQPSAQQPTQPTQPPAPPEVPGSQGGGRSFSEYGEPVEAPPQGATTSQGEAGKGKGQFAGYGEPVDTEDTGQMPGVIEAAGQGLKRGGQELAQTAETLAQGTRSDVGQVNPETGAVPIVDPTMPAMQPGVAQPRPMAPPVQTNMQPLPAETSPAAKQIEFGDWLHPGTLLPKLAYGTGRGAAEIAGAAGAGALGTAAGGPLAGAAAAGLTAGGIQIFQALGPYYVEALKETHDPDKAYELAIKKADLDGVISAASFAAFGVTPFNGILKNLLFQSFGMQPSIAVAGKVAKNLQEGKPWDEDVEKEVPGAIAGTLIPGAATHAALYGRGPNRAAAPGTTPPVTEHNLGTDTGEFFTRAGGAPEPPPGGGGPGAAEAPPRTAKETIDEFIRQRDAAQAKGFGKQFQEAARKAEEAAKAGGRDVMEALDEFLRQNDKSKNPWAEQAKNEENLANQGYRRKKEEEEAARAKAAGEPTPAAGGETEAEHGEKAPETAETGEKQPVATFKTAKGSTYQVHEDGTTTRTKAARPEHPGDEGLQPRSAKTVYLDKDAANAIAPPEGSWRMVDAGDGRVALATKGKDGKWGISKSAIVAFSDKPEVGKIPLELWKKETINGKDAYRRSHFGNDITEVGGGGGGAAAGERIDLKTTADLARASEQASQDHTHEEGEAQTYRMGKASWNGVPISIEAPAGGVRRGVNPKTGEKWEGRVGTATGFIEGTKGGDGQELDVNLGPYVDNPTVFIINENNPDGSFRQTKSMIGFKDAGQAVDAYLTTPTKSFDRIGGVAVMDAPQFKDWVANGDHTKPAKAPGGKATEAPAAAAEEQIPETAHPRDYHAAHADVEKAIRAIGEDPAGVRPADIARAAEIMLDEGHNAGDAFVIAFGRGLMDAGKMTPAQARNIYDSKIAEAIVNPPQAKGTTMEPGGASERGPRPEAPGAGAGRPPAAPGAAEGVEAAPGQHAGGGKAGEVQAAEAQPHGQPGEHAAGQEPHPGGAAADQEQPAEHGVGGAAAGAEAAERPPQERAARPAQRAKGAVKPHSLLEFLAARGGLKPTPELRDLELPKSILVPGMGWRSLIRGAGDDLDTAREAAVEAGYITEELGRAGGGKSTPNDLLRKISEEGRGRRQMAMGEEEEKTARQREIEEETGEVRADALRHQKTRLTDYLRSTGTPIDAFHPEDVHLAIELMEDDGLDPDRAIEKAWMTNVAKEDLVPHEVPADIYGEVPFDDEVRAGAAPEDGGRAGEAGGEGPEVEEGRPAEPGPRGIGVGAAGGEERKEEPEPEEVAVRNPPTKLTEATPAGEQHVLPGAEAGPAARAGENAFKRGKERAAPNHLKPHEKADWLKGYDQAAGQLEKSRPKVAQKPADEGLFGEHGQTDLVDMAKKPDINRANTVPYLAGASNTPTGLPINIDNRVPTEMTVKGVTFSPDKYLKIHELKEYTLMKAGEPYETAHRAALKDEKAAVEADGIDWDAYQEQMHKLAEKIEKEPHDNPPANLYTKPYPHREAEFLKQEAQQNETKAQAKETPNAPAAETAQPGEGAGEVRGGGAPSAGEKTPPRERKFTSYTTEHLKKAVASPNTSPKLKTAMQEEINAREGEEAIKPLETIPGDGLEALIFQNSDGKTFNVMFRDPDSGNTLPNGRVKIGSLIAARAIAKEVLEGKRPATEKPAKAGPWEPIGKNPTGHTLYEDSRWVRSYVVGGVRHTEPVLLRPTRGGVQVARTEREDEFKIAEAGKWPGAAPAEIEAKPAPKPAATKKALSDAFDDELGEAPPPKAPKMAPPRAPRAAATEKEHPRRPAAPISKPAATGMDKAVSRLTKIFKKPPPGGLAEEIEQFGVDPEIYEQVKPGFFEAASDFPEHFDDPVMIIRSLVKALKASGFTHDDIAAMKPYAMQFTEDVMNGVIDLRKEVAELEKGTDIEAEEKADEGRHPREDKEALDNLPPEQGQGPQGPGGAPGEHAGGGTTGPGGDRSPAGPGVSGARGGRGGTEKVRVSRSGGGGGRAGVGAGGTRGKRTRVPTEPASVDPAEAPSIPAANFHITEDVRLGEGGEATKFADNIAAIKIVKALDRENRRATPDEQRALARYVGWGGMPNAFADQTTGEFKDGWEKRGAELAALLTPEELRQARRSTQNAHYTSKTVVDAMWRAARHLGFDGGLTMETSAGTGNFMGLVPRDIAGRTRFIAIEKDDLTSRITRALYPQETVLHAGLEEVPLPDGEAVLNIGNPPFGSNSLPFQFKPDFKGLSIHNQFFLAGLDALRPGGLQINVVSRYLMDAIDSGAREKIATRAKLIGAIRLPDTAFKENARTEVVTDIVILQRLTPAEQTEMEDAVASLHERAKGVDAEQKRKDRADKVPDWVNVTDIADPLGGEAIKVNKYFAKNPHMVMGRLERSGSMRQENDVTVKLDKSADLGALLNKAVDRLPRGILDLGKEIMEASLARHKGMSEALEVALAGHEPGHVESRDGRLFHIYERETPTGGSELARRVLTPNSPWSRQLNMDDKGRWFTMAPKLNAKGEKIKTDEVVNDKGEVVKKGHKNLYVRNFFPDNNVPSNLRIGDTKFSRLVDLVKLRDLTKRQLVLEANDVAEPEMEDNRRKLAKAYRDYVAKNGLLNDQKNSSLLSEMPDGALVQALESSYRPAISAARAAARKEKPRDASATPAPILSRRVVPKYEPATTADSPHDALQITLSERGRIDMRRIADLLGVPEAEAIAKLQAGDKPLVFWDPEQGVWETRDAYLSGNVRKKLNAARASLDSLDAPAHNIKINVPALEAVQPEAWTAENVTAVMGANWIPPEYYISFAKHLVGGKHLVEYSPLTNSFDLRMIEEPDRAKVLAWRTDDMPFERIYNGILNSHVPAVMVPGDTEGSMVREPALSELVRLKALEIESEFSNWVFADGDRRKDLVSIFNDKFNTRVTRQHDGSHLTLPGKVPDEVIKMRRHQLNAIWRGIHERFMLLDHVVGAGKTFTAIARIMERRRMGLSRKPMVVVPNHLVEQWTADVYRLYPGAKVLAAGKNQFDRSNRRRLFAKIATGDYDVVIVPHSSFGFIGISPETERRFLEEELRIAKEAIEEAKEAAAEEGIGGFRKPFNVKQAEKLADTIEARMSALKKQKHEKLLTFEQMGVDDLTVDEAHEFKNLFYSSRLINVRGMGDRGGSQKAFDLYNKIRVLRESPTGTVTFLTGTPISNSAVEMYTMMRYLAANELKELGIEHFDAWRSQSVSASTAYEPTESGGLKEVTRLGRQWANMRALMELYYSFTDAVPQEDITKWYAEDNPGKEFPVPRVKSGGRKEVVVKPTEAQDRILKAVVDDFDSLPGIQDPIERNAERLRLMDRARKLSLDARAVYPNMKSDEAGGKLDQIADNVARIHKEWTPDRGTQLIFLDRGVKASKQDVTQIKEYDDLVEKKRQAQEKGDEEAYRRAIEELDRFNPNEIEELRNAQRGGWNAYEQLKYNLVKRGIPDEEIKFIQDANSDAEKRAIFDAVNDGAIRVLIGSTPKMGAGTNVQERLVALHHADVTWKPSDIEQREGRIIRQGNKLLEKYGRDFQVEILAYVTERTVDAKMWSLNATKLKMINGIRKYDGSFNMEFEDEDAIGMAEIAALASGDPLLLERVKLTAEIDKLELQKSGFQRRMWGIEDAINAAQRAIKEYPERIEATKKAAKEVLDAYDVLFESAEKRSVDVEGETYTRSVDAMQAAEKEIEKQQAGNENAKYSINVGGNRYSNKAGIEEAIGNALGDKDPFEAQVGGETFRRRTQLAKHIQENMQKSINEMEKRSDRTIKIGTMLGGEIELQLHKRDKLIEASLALSKAGRTIAAYSPYDAEYDKGVSLQAARGMFDGLVNDLNNVAKSTGEFMQEAIDKAKAELPTLLEQKKEAFPKAAELAQKVARLREVTKELADRTAAAEGRHKAPPKEEEPGTGLAQGLGFGPVEFTPLTAPKITSDRGAEAQKLVVKEGRATGREFLMAFNAKGKIVEYGAGTQTNVGLRPEFDALLSDPKQDIVLHHNHPNNASLSQHDIAMLGRKGLKAVWAHGHEGMVARAELTPEFRRVAANDTTRQVSVGLWNMWNAIGNELYGPLQKIVGSGDLTPTEAGKLFNHLINLVMHMAGVITYESNIRVGAEIAKFNLYPHLSRLAEKLTRSFPSENRPGNDRPATGLRYAGDVGTVFGQPQGIVGQGRPQEGNDRERGADDRAKAARALGPAGFAEEIERFGTPLAKSKAAEIKDNLLAWGRHLMGPRAKIEFEDTIPIERRLGGYGDIELGQTYGGVYTPAYSLVQIALEDPQHRDPQSNLFHEAFHFVEDHFATPEELAVAKRENPILRSQVEKFLGMKPGQLDQLSDFEVRAYAFERYMNDRFRGQHPGGIHAALRRFFERGFDYIRRIRNYLHGLGFKTTSDFFATVASGEPATRPSRMIEGGQPSRITGDYAARASFPTTREAYQAIWDRFMEGTQDLSRRVQQLEEDVRARQFGTLPDSQAFYEMKRLFPGKRDFRVREFNRLLMKPLFEHLERNHISAKEFGNYLYARHAVERNKKLGVLYEPTHDFFKAMTDPSIVGASGMSQNEANAIITRAMTSPKRQGYIDGTVFVHKIIDFINTAMVEGDLETQGTIDVWNAMYREYVPLSGFEDEEDEDGPRTGGSFDVRGKEVKAAFGRRSKANNPLENLLNLAYRTIERAEKNRYKRSLADALNALTPADRADMGVRINIGPMKKQINKATGRVEQVPDPGVRFSPHSVHFKVRGQSWFIHFDERAMAEVVNRMSPDQLNPLAMGLLDIQNKLKALWTHYSPDFLVRHFLARYPIEAFMNAIETEGLKGAAKVWWRGQPLGSEAVRAIFRNGGTEPIDRYWAEMKAQGGAMMFRNMRDMDLMREDLKLGLRALRGGPLRTVGDRLVAVREAMDHITNTLDNALRLSVFAAARERGLSPQKAAMMARDATVDFQLKGKWANAIGVWFPFGNVATQTAARMAKAVTRSKVMKTVFAATIGAGFALSAWNYLGGGVDKDGIPFFEKVPEWERRLNFIMMNPFNPDAEGRPDVIKVPMPYNWAMPLSIGYASGGVVWGKMGTAAALTQVTQSVLEAMSPVGPIMENPTDVLMPELARPFGHLFTNKDAFGRPIHSDPTFQKVPNAYYGKKDYKGIERTGVYWKSLAESINDLTGGTPKKRGLIDIYPEDYREMFDYAFGTQKRLLMNIYKTAKDVQKGKHDPTHVPMERVFHGTDYDAANRHLAYEKSYKQKHPQER